MRCPNALAETINRIYKSEVIEYLKYSWSGVKDIDNHIAKGFNELETEVRLTYETLSRQLAPYIGLNYEAALVLEVLLVNDVQQVNLLIAVV